MRPKKERIRIARIAGAATSTRKQKAARANGKLGGRPRKKPATRKAKPSTESAGKAKNSRRPKTSPAR